MLIRITSYNVCYTKLLRKYGEMWGNVLANGKAVWVAPLEPNGFWRWVFNPVTPGYFVVSHSYNFV